MESGLKIVSHKCFYKRYESLLHDACCNELSANVEWGKRGEHRVGGEDYSDIGHGKTIEFDTINVVDDLTLELLLVGAVGGDGRLCLLDRRDVIVDLLLERIQLGDHRLVALSLHA